MRTLTAEALAKIATQYGSKPVNILAVQWQEGGSYIYYADRDIEGIDGKIITISEIDAVISISDSSDSQAVQVVLSDHDGDLKGIIDTVDVHLKSAKVYQYFQGMSSLDEKFLVFKGQVNSPVEWDERGRTLSFTIVSKIEDAEVGFSVDEGVFPFAPDELTGKPWPLVFGTCIDVPALRAVSPYSGTLGTGVGIVDFTLPYLITAAERLTCPIVYRATGAQVSQVGAGYNITIGGIYAEDDGCQLDRCAAIERFTTAYQEQLAVQSSTMRIIGGKRFPQGAVITLEIDNGQFTGRFDGTEDVPTDVFTIISRKHPDYDELIARMDYNAVRAELEAQRREGLVSRCISNGSNSSAPEDGEILLDVWGNPPDGSRTRVEESELTQRVFNATPTSTFFWVNPGATVRLVDDAEIIYIANILPSTVIRVSAKRQLDNGTFVVTVPESYYTVRTTDYTSYDVTEIVFSKPLSSFGDGWDDDSVVVTMTSSVGPNTVDIIQWLIEKYTGSSIDSTSFVAVKAKLTNYPSNFAVLDRPNILRLLSDIAYQARCAIFLRDDTFYLLYLSELPTPVATITESDIDAGSLVLSHSPTEELITKYTATWKSRYSQESDNTMIFRHNVAKYGTHDSEINYFIYNINDYVKKSATFWLIRKANTWRLVKFKTPLQLMNLETFDPITLDVSSISDSPVVCVLTKASYDSESKSMSFEAWTPIRSGSREAYDFAYPAALPPEEYFPSDSDISSGSAGAGNTPGFTTIAPPDHPLGSNYQTGYANINMDMCVSGPRTAGFSDSPSCNSDRGDSNPSDENDEYKDPDAYADNTPEVNTGKSAAEIRALGGQTEVQKANQTAGDAKAIAKNAQEIANAANEAAGGTGSGSGAEANGDFDIESLPDIDDVPDDPEGEEKCRTYVTITWTMSEIAYVGLPPFPYCTFDPTSTTENYVVEGDVADIFDSLTRSASVSNGCGPSITVSTTVIGDCSGEEQIGNMLGYRTSDPGGPKLFEQTYTP